MKKDYLQLAGYIKNVDQTGKSYYELVEDFLKLKKLAKRLSTLDTNECNGYYKEGVYDKKVSAIYFSLDKMARDLKINYYHQSDPRGASLYISIQPLTTSNYNYGLAIY
jgi:hypothetical protein